MFISGATPKKEVDALIKAVNKKDKKYHYSAVKNNTGVGHIWKITKTKK